MQVPRKQHRKRRLSLGGSQNSCVRHRAMRRNHVWSYDFVAERTEDGRTLRMLVVIDEFTRECLVIEVGRSFTSDDVIGVLQYLFAIRGVPEHIRSDNGPEFVAKGIRRWLVQAGVTTLFIAKSSPWENGYVESFNGKFRDELLNGELFLGLADARWVIDRGVLTTTTGGDIVPSATKPRPRSRPTVFWRILLRSIHQNTELLLT